MSYTKLHESLVHSTIWREPNHIRVVWVTMMALADKNGEIQASIPGLADLARVTIEECEQALKRFQEPDKYSRTPDFSGRRIEEIEGGWALLNHPKYRAMASREDSKDKAAERQRRRRNPDESKRDSHALSRFEAKSLHIAEAEAEADNKNKPRTPVFGPDPAPVGDPGGGLSLEFQEEGQRKQKNPNTPEMVRIGNILNRRPTTKWSADEKKAFRGVEWIEEDISIVEDFYAFQERDREPLFRRTSLLTLLRHWSDEVGKAGAWAKRYGRPQRAKTTNTNQVWK